MSQQLLNHAIKQQQVATNPIASAWVSASAGTGKTKVLIDRLLALLLHGANPEHILCLTFTKAAASEMQQRLFEALQNWVIQDEITLRHTLTSVLATPPTADQILRARQLYTLALEAPGGLKVSTIHGFCQTLLARFPLEAGITPNFGLLDERQGNEILDQAKRRVLANILNQEQQDLTRILVSYFKDGSFQDILQDVLANRRYFYKILEKYPDLESYTTALCQKLELNLSEKDILDLDLPLFYFCQAYHLSAIDRDRLLAIVAETDNPILAEWLSCNQAARMDLFEGYCSLYLTKKGDFLKKTKVACETEAQQVYHLNKTLRVLELAQKSACIFSLACDVFHEYQQLKQRQNLLDYDDLIERTIHLLTQPDISPWILHKLDGGIHHLLVDEAQDTNPDQWRVILALTEDFLTPHQTQRTLFVVGDVKQSIYSFQGASPHDFIQLREWFREKCQAIGQAWYDIDLIASFRSTPEILAIVDKIVNQQEHRVAIQLHDQETRHLAFRSEHQGSVCLLPAILTDKQTASLESWPIPDKYRRIETPLDQVCQQVGLKIQQLLWEKGVLPSTGKPIEPKDILILVKQRGDLAPRLIRYLKKQAVPVAGMDRFLLNNHLAVQDLIALGQFLLLPQDDLSLACVLKGPLIELTEEELMHLAAPRAGSLWQELSQRYCESIKYQAAFDLLKLLLCDVDYLTPYQFYHSILFKLEGLKKFRTHFGIEADDAIMEFLNYAFKVSENKPTTLQQFLGEIQETNREIRRDNTDNTQNQVRVMTVHGSKGLQAPVVFIVEKFKKRSMPDRLLWELNEAREGMFMIIRPRSDRDTSYTSYLKIKAEHLDSQEEKRLFYVALTRAQDHLYLTGYDDSEIPENSWYQWLKDEALMTDVKEMPIPCYIAEQAQNKDENWLLKPIKHRKISSPMHEESQKQTTVMQRGILIHRLFELLLDLPAPVREKTAKSYLQKHNVNKIDIPLTAVLDILSSEILQPFAQGRSIAEMEIAGEDGKLMRLDRVAITENTVKILDFKTSENIPASIKQTPKAILTQLAYYATIMATIYPNHRIECYLLWISGPVLHYIPEVLLHSKSDIK